jgi:transcriptional regulator GlxA family with amidase domain
MDIVLFLFDGITALDIVGPFDVLKRLPEARIRLVSPPGGTVRTGDSLLGLGPAEPMASVDRAHVLVVPGGFGTRRLQRDEAVLGWIRAVHETTRFTTSVCTGSFLLGAAGLLRGRRATTHWAFLDRLSAYGAEPVTERVVFSGKIVTAAGVSAGIDMALALAARLAGDTVAQGIQLGLEYDPAPGFDAGSPRTADPRLVTLVRDALLERESRYAG